LKLTSDPGGLDLKTFATPAPGAIDPRLSLPKDWFPTKLNAPDVPSKNMDAGKPPPALAGGPMLLQILLPS
jgi:hypothetical protein